MAQNNTPPKAKVTTPKEQIEIIQDVINRMVGRMGKLAEINQSLNKKWEQKLLEQFVKSTTAQFADLTLTCRDYLQYQMIKINEYENQTKKDNSAPEPAPK